MSKFRLLLNLVRRHGLLVGLFTWCECRRGHDFQSVGGMYVKEQGELQNGIGMQVGIYKEGQCKMVCRRCRHAKLLDLEVYKFNDGTTMAFAGDEQLGIVAR